MINPTPATDIDGIRYGQTIGSFRANESHLNSRLLTISFYWVRRNIAEIFIAGRVREYEHKSTLSNFMLR